MSPTGDRAGASPEILDRIVDHARSAPTRLAAWDTARELDYAALRTEVGEVAAGLVGRGVGPGDRVAVHLPNSVDFLVTVLAALWVGAVFVPLAVTDPQLRLLVIIDDCDPALIVTSAPGGDAGPVVGVPSLVLSELRVVGATPPPPARDPERPVYAIYTSGTTGTPKGVLVGQGAFAAAVEATIDALDLDEATRTLCVSAFHFDGSFATLFPTLVAGGCVVMPRRYSLVFARTFFNAVAHHRITYTGFSPSYLRLLLSNPRVSGLAESTLRVVALGGEAASGPDVAALRAAAPQLRIFNRYGPTETTIAVTHHEILPTDDDGATVPIGRPHPGVTFFLLDEDNRVIERSGQMGELYIGGSQLMLGYWRAPELSAEVLRSDLVVGTTLYRTGDLVVRNDAGNYLYVDRVDRVVKRSGVRISLVEVTEVLRRVPGVSAVSTTLFDDAGRLGIAAFVVAGDLGAEEVQRTASRSLPATMLPDRIVTVDSIPLTPAGKVDERRLLAAADLGATLRRPQRRRVP